MKPAPTPTPDPIIPHDYVWHGGIVLSPAQVDAYNRYTVDINAATYAPSKELLRDNRHKFLVNALADASAPPTDDERKLNALIDYAIRSQNQLWDAVSAIEQHLGVEESAPACNLIVERMETLSSTSPPGQLQTFEIRALAADVRAASVAPDVEYFPGATKCEIGQVMMQDVIGDYDVPDDVPEWIWVQKVASFEHKDNADSGIWEFVVNLSFGSVWNGQDEPDIPQKLVPVFEEAYAKGFQYLIFHQGT